MSAENKFEMTGRTGTDYGGPAIDVVPVTPHDSNELNVVCDAIQVVGAGDLVFKNLAGTNRTVPLTPGLWPIRARQILATGTTCTGIYAWYCR